MCVMKYLFRGAVGKELMESEVVMDANDESLEETVLLIKRNYVGIFYRFDFISLSACNLFPLL